MAVCRPVPLTSPRCHRGFTVRTCSLTQNFFPVLELSGLWFPEGDAPGTARSLRTPRRITPASRAWESAGDAGRSRDVDIPRVKASHRASNSLYNSSAELVPAKTEASPGRERRALFILGAFFVRCKGSWGRLRANSFRAPRRSLRLPSSASFLHQPERDRLSAHLFERIGSP